jgi:DNA-binding response OmpR family regulator
MSERPRILIVEDDDNVRLSLVVFLENDGYEVVEASDVAGARHVIESTTVQAAVLDRYLGNVLGTDLIAELRERHPGIVIAVVSGDSSATPGADIRMTKSEHPSFLLRELRRRLGRSGKG